MNVVMHRPRDLFALAHVEMKKNELRIVGRFVQGWVTTYIWWSLYPNR